MTTRIKGKVYKTTIKPKLIYGAEAWSLRRKEELLLQKTEIRRLRWIHGVSLRDRKRSDDICREMGAASFIRCVKPDYDGLVMYDKQQVCLTCLKINNAYVQQITRPRMGNKTQAGVQHLLYQLFIITISAFTRLDTYLTVLNRQNVDYLFLK